MDIIKKGFHSISITDVIDYIDGNIFILPSIQRRFVWDKKKIEALFDSIYKELPFGVLLLESINSKNKDSKISYYKFLQDDLKEEEKYLFNNGSNYVLSNSKNYYSVIDGQQRLTALYSGIKTNYIDKNNQEYKLCFRPTISNGNYFKYVKSSKIKNNRELFITMEQIYKFKNIGEITKKFPNVRIRNKISRLYSFIYNKKVIGYHCFEMKKLNDDYNEKVLSMFIRLNSGGIKLEPADLLFSQIALYSNDKIEARKVLDTYINKLNGKDGDIKFSVNYFIRTLWMIFGKGSFNSFYTSGEIKKYCNIEEFDKVYNSLQKAKSIFLESNFKFTSGTSYNMFLPIAYYYYYLDESIIYNDRDIKYEIAKFYETVSISGYLSGSSDGTLMSLRKALSNETESNCIKLFTDKKFNFKKLQKKLNKTHTDKEKRLEVTKTMINNIVKYSYEKDKDKIGVILSLLKKDKAMSLIDENDIDHIHPKYLLTEKEYKKASKKFNTNEYRYFKSTCHLLPNLQLLNKTENRTQKNKTPFYKWLKTKREKYYDDNLIKYKKPIDYYKIDNYKIFYKDREKMIKQELLKIIGS